VRTGDTLGVVAIRRAANRDTLRPSGQRGAEARVIAVCTPNGEQIRGSPTRSSHPGGPEIGVASTKTFMDQVAAGEKSVGRAALAGAKGTKSATRWRGSSPRWEAIAGADHRGRGVVTRSGRWPGHSRVQGSFPGRHVGYPVAWRVRSSQGDPGVQAREGSPAGEQARPIARLIEEGLPVV